MPLSHIQYGFSIWHVSDKKSWKRLGPPVGLGVDGSASNDSSNLMEGVRHALMINRLQYGSAAITHHDAFRWATEGSAACLGRQGYREIGSGQAG